MDTGLLAITAACLNLEFLNLGWCQQELGLSEPLDHPTRFGFFLTFATCVPNMLSIPCFYFSGNRYVEHKKKEEAFIEAAESF